MRYAIAFLAGFLSTLIFHQGLIAILHRIGAWPRPAYPMNPTWPLGIPQILSTSLWAGVWAILLALFLARWNAGASYWIGWLLAGAIAPTVVALWIVLPLKGKAMAGGWDSKIVVGGLLVNGAWGLGTALLLKLLRRVW